MMMGDVSGYPADKKYRNDDQRQNHYQHFPAKLEFLQRMVLYIHVPDFPSEIKMAITIAQFD
jgi:hypothetical protein